MLMMIFSLSERLIYYEWHVLLIYYLMLRECIHIDFIFLYSVILYKAIHIFKYPWWCLPTDSFELYDMSTILAMSPLVLVCVKTENKILQGELLIMDPGLLHHGCEYINNYNCRLFGIITNTNFIPAYKINLVKDNWINYDHILLN